MSQVACCYLQDEHLTATLKKNQIKRSCHIQQFNYQGPQNLTYSLHEAGGGNDWWNRFQPVMEVQSILGTPVG